MIYSSTGFAYLLLSFALGFLSFRFFQYWQENRDTISKSFLYFAISLNLFALFKAVSGLFFADNAQILVNSTIFASFVQGLAAAIVAYLIIYLNFPKVSPWVGFGIIFTLGLIATWFTIINPPFQPFLEASGAINWGALPFTETFYYTILRMGIILITFLSLIIIFIQQARVAEEAYVKIRLIGFSLILLLGIILGTLDFFLIKLFNLSAMVRDVVTGSLSILLFVVILLTQRSPTKTTEKNL